MKTLKRKLSTKEKAEIKKKKARLQELLYEQQEIDKQVDNILEKLRKAEDRQSIIYNEILDLEDEIEHP